MAFKEIKMTRILIAGSRSYNDYEEFRDIMNFICKDYNDIEIVSGEQMEQIFSQKSMRKNIN